MTPTYESVRCLAALSVPLLETLSAVETKWLPETPPPTIAMGDIGLALACQIKRISADEMRLIFNLAETFMIEGDERLQTAIATGFLEALLAESSAGRLDFRRIAPFLGKKSREYARAWDQFCGVETDGL